MEKEIEPVVFDPEKGYSWLDTDQFSIGGKEFEIVHNTLASVFSTNTPLPSLFVALHQCFQITSNIFKRNVESGLIKEAEKK